MTTANEFPELPQDIVSKLLKTITDVKVSSNAKGVFSKAAGLFVMFVHTIANEFCREANRHTISSADIIRALREIDFEHFVGNLQRAPGKERASAAKRQVETRQ